MPTLARPHTRSIIGFVMSLLGVLALAGAALAPAAGAEHNGAHDPPGNNGTVKIDGIPLDPGPGDDGPGHRDNEPQIDCEAFAVDFYQFDQSTDDRSLYADVEFRAWPPTGERGLLIPVTAEPAYTPSDGTPALDGDRVYIGEDEAGDADDLDASIVYELDFTGIEPHEQQGYHVKLTVHADSVRPGPQNDVKHKVFWIGPCEEAPEEGETGALTVTKTVVNGDNNRAFRFDVDCDGEEFDQSFTLKHGESETIDGIPVGTECVVTEDAAAGYTTTVVPSDGTVTIDADGETVAFTNTVPTTGGGGGGGGGGGVVPETEVGGEVIERPTSPPPAVPVSPGIAPPTPFEEAPEVLAESVEQPRVLGAQVTRSAPQPAPEVLSARLARTGPSQVPTLLAVAGFSLLIGGALVLLQGRLASTRRRLTV